MKKGKFIALMTLLLAAGTIMGCDNGTTTAPCGCDNCNGQSVEDTYTHEEPEDEHTARPPLEQAI